MRSPASAAIMAISSGVMKRAQSCVPAGTTPSSCSAAAMARAYDRGVRLSVDTTSRPPGAMSDASTCAHREGRRQRDRSLTHPSG